MIGGIRYFCYVGGIGPMAGSGRIVTCVFATLRTESAEHALRWLVHQVDHVADRLDPGPVPGLECVPAPEADGPALMRAWHTDPANRRHAWNRLVNEGRGVSLIFPDGLDHYRFGISPEWKPARARLPRPPL
ncbi:hypothetical protein ACFVIM_20800 [Streptomyces sp. NPDC057638]|uniref:hypothetical protein n=1 Tax=Streptomyces sp. NPDC057638 TaxID=3346190 RepID=UPI003680DFE7